MTTPPSRHDIRLAESISRAGVFYRWVCSCGKRGARPYYYRGLAEGAGLAHARTMINEKR
jgi:hypothetical protein